MGAIWLDSRIIVGMKNAPLIGFALILLHSMSMTAGAETKAVTLEPIPLKLSLIHI